MLEKRDERHQKWLISDEEREYETFVAEGLGEWADIDQTLLELEAMRLDFSVSFDYDLTAIGSAADKAISELKALFGSQGTIFNNAINSQLTCLLANLYLGYQRNNRRLIRISQHNGKAVPPRYNPSGVATKSLKKIKNALLANEYVFFQGKSRTGQDITPEQITKDHCRSKLDRIPREEMWMEPCDHRLPQCSRNHPHEIEERREQKTYLRLLRRYA